MLKNVKLYKFLKLYSRFTLINLPILLILIVLITQNIDAKIKSKIIFKDGNKISGEVVQTDINDSILVKLGGGFNVSYAKKDISEIISLRNVYSVGIGVGINYGMFGLNLEIEPINHLDLTIALGTTLIKGYAWEVGIVGYVLDQDYVIRPRLSLIYGTNSFIRYDTEYNSKYEFFEGISFGGGLKLQMGESHSLTMDLFILVTDGSKKRQKELEKIGYYFQEQGIPAKISTGYQFSF